MNRYWPIGVIVAAFAALGVANVLKTPLGQSEAALETQEKLDRMQTAFAGWTSEPVVVSPEELQLAEAQAHLSRMFRNEKTGVMVNTLLLYGAPGPLGAHTPQVCFKGAGYAQIGKESRVRITPDREFWTATFDKESLPPSTLQVFWGWGLDGVWKASDHARLDFAGQSRIFKLYVSWIVPAQSSDMSVYQAFTEKYLEKLQKTLSQPVSH